VLRTRPWNLASAAGKPDTINLWSRIKRGGVRLNESFLP
jgi:hypothetical protein